MEVSMFTPTCLLCNTYFDRKPRINDSGTGIAKKFKTAFNLFCKLLKGLERERDPLDGVSLFEIDLVEKGDLADDRFRRGHPCCGECYVALLGLNKLEEIIKETRAQQQVILENLKGSVSNSRDRTCHLDKEWEEVRIQLLGYIKDPDVHTTQLGNIGEEEVFNTDWYHSENSDNDLDPPYSPCFIVPNIIDGSEPEPGTLESYSYQEGPSVKRRGKSTKNVTSTPASKPSIPKCQHPAAANLTPCFVSLAKLDIKDFPNLRIPESQQTVELKMRQSISKILSANANKQPKQLIQVNMSEKTKKTNAWLSHQFQQHFYYINEEILLFFCTPIKFSPSGFTCLDRNCKHFVEGSDYSTFENMKEHVIQSHQKDYGSARSCPLCEGSFTSVKKIRRHILIDHAANGKDCPTNLSRVICEICMKTMRQQNHCVHVWLHKNEEEKEAMLANGEKIYSRLICSAEFRKWKRKRKVLVPTPSATNETRKRKVGFEFSTRKSSAPIVPVGDTTIEELERKNVELLEFADCVGEGRRLRDSASRTKSKKIKIYTEDMSDLSASESNINSDSDSDYQPMPHQEIIPVREKTSKKTYSVNSDSDCGTMTGNGNVGTESTVENIENTMLDILGPLEKEKIVVPYVPAKEITTYRKEKVFVIINNEILLFYCTPIKYSPSGFTCLEQDCSHFEEGSDFFAYENMKKHVIECHEKDYECGEKIRNCPICGKSCYAGISILNHILGAHTTFRKGFYCGYKVVCESCYKTMPYGSYECHVWRHKNAQEKRDMLKNREELNPKLRCKLGLNKGRFRIRDRNRIEKSKIKDRARKTKTKTTSKKPFNEDPGSCQTTFNQNRIQERPLNSLKKRKSKDISSDKKVKGDGDNSEVKRAIELHLAEFNPDNLFYLLGENVLLYKDILLKFSSTEFICQEDGCGTQILGSDYHTFKLVRKHVINKKRASDFSENAKRTCPICNMKFIGVLPFRDHIFTVHSPPAVCTICWKPIQCYYDVKGHAELHMSKQDKEEATEDLQRTAALRREKRFGTENGKGLKTFACKSCPNTYRKLFYLKAHEESHLPRHLRKHFDCPDCGVQLLSKAALKSHVERVHRPELVTRKRKCHICVKEFHFRDGEAYRGHIRRHIGDTPYQCDLCGKGFTTNWLLKIHSRTVHSTARPYQCEFCVMKYKSMKSLKRHQRSAHNELVELELDEEMKLKFTNMDKRPDFIGPRMAYPCEHCGKVFQLRSRMTKHVKTAHGNVDEDNVTVPSSDPLADL